MSAQLERDSGQDDWPQPSSGRHELRWYQQPQAHDDTPVYTQTLRETPVETHPAD